MWGRERGKGIEDCFWVFGLNNIEVFEGGDNEVRMVVVMR